MQTRTWKDCEGIRRRDFLKIGTAGLMGVGLSDLLRLEAQGAAKAAKKAKGVILIWLPGGPATIDMWDLKPDAPEGIRGEFKEIDTSAAGIRISEHLPQVAKVIDRATIVRSLYHNIGAHGLGTVYMTTGNKPSAALKYPLLGSLTAKLLPVEPGIPPHVTFGRTRDADAGYLGTAYNPFEVEGNAGGGTLRVKGISLPNNFSLGELEDRNKLLDRFDSSFKALDSSAELAAGLDKFQQQALEILRSDKTKNAFNLGNEPDSVRDRYGKDASGQGVLAARRLIEAGVRFVTVSMGGWDTHSNNFQTLKTRNLPLVDKTVSALIEDLDSKGLLDSTIVYVAGEFGRTPKVNQRSGRDHWGRSLAVLLAGGGFKKGYAHGTTDAQGMAPANDPCRPDDISATMFNQLGIDPATEVMTNTGRPVQIFREGQILRQLLA